MLYEVITDIGGKTRDQLNQFLDENYLSKMDKVNISFFYEYQNNIYTKTVSLDELGRITSYNVCYTKLLRIRIAPTVYPKNCLLSMNAENSLEDLVIADTIKL